MGRGEAPGNQGLLFLISETACPPSVMCQGDVLGKVDQKLLTRNVNRIIIDATVALWQSQLEGCVLSMTDLNHL